MAQPKEGPEPRLLDSGDYEIVIETPEEEEARLVREKEEAYKANIASTGHVRDNITGEVFDVMFAGDIILLTLASPQENETLEAGDVISIRSLKDKKSTNLTGKRELKLEKMMGNYEPCNKKGLTLSEFIKQISVVGHVRRRKFREDKTKRRIATVDIPIDEIEESGIMPPFYPTVACTSKTGGKTMKTDPVKLIKHHEPCLKNGEPLNQALQEAIETTFVINGGTGVKYKLLGRDPEGKLVLQQRGSKQPIAVDISEIDYGSTYQPHDPDRTITRSIKKTGEESKRKPRLVPSQKLDKPAIEKDGRKTRNIRTSPRSTNPKARKVRGRRMF